MHAGLVSGVALDEGRQDKRVCRPKRATLRAKSAAKEAPCADLLLLPGEGCALACDGHCIINLHLSEEL